MKNMLTPDKKIRVMNKVKDSKFYGSISSAANRKEAENFISEISDEFSDATHNVNAYRIGSDSDLIEYADDDGEPSGSSGPPVLEAIKGEGLTNTVIVVSRFFGGTKLGIGGLIRAYGNTARMAIEESGKKELKLLYNVRVKGNYDNVGVIMGQIEAFKGKIINTKYNSQGVEIDFLIKPFRYENFRDKLIEMSSNAAKIEKIGHKYTVTKSD